MRGYLNASTCSNLFLLNNTASSQTVFFRLRRLVIGGIATATLLAVSTGRAASFQTDANNFVVMEAEDFDLNVTQNNGLWQFDNTPLAVDTFSGWGYMKGLYSGGTDTNLSPRLDYTINFQAAGTYYIWVSGSDAGGKSVNIGLDGVVPASANDIGGADGAFGARDGGEIVFLSNHNDGSGYTPGARPYLTIPAPGEHTLNVFIREPGFYCDRILLTTNISFIPSPIYGSGQANVPAETLVPSANLTVAITQPANNKSLYGGPSNLVSIVAKPKTNGPAVSKVEFFSKLVSAGSYTYISEAASQPYMVTWTNSPTGSNMLMAVVTDGAAQKATSTVATVFITLPPALTPLKWTTNNFVSSLGSWTLQSQNHDLGFNVDWQNSTNAGGPAGEFGGHVVRRSDIHPYVAEPLSRPVNLNEDLWLRGNMMFSNVDMNADTFIGFFDTNSFARLGLKVREPTGSGGVWRFRVKDNVNISPAATLADKTVGQFELHWLPSGQGDGSGTLTGSVAGVVFTPLNFGASSESYNAFGYYVPTQGDTDTNRHSFQYFDSVEYVIPTVALLNIQSLAGNKVLLFWEVADYLLQYNDSSVVSNAWVDYNTNNVVQAGGTYYATNSVSVSNRWYRLRHPLF